MPAGSDNASPDSARPEGARPDGAFPGKAPRDNASSRDASSGDASFDSAPPGSAHSAGRPFDTPPPAGPHPGDALPGTAPPDNAPSGGPPPGTTPSGTTPPGTAPFAGPRRPPAGKAAARAMGEALLARLAAAGAQVVEADILQPAGTLLDLYGEDIRARAYTLSDPLRGEVMLRPDFTVPVVQKHMAGGADPARYTYFGEVFRRQEHRGPRAAEYFQVGYEVFDRGDPNRADAEVFALFFDLLGPLGLRAATGDIGILLAAVRGLATTEERKARLLHHIWRPRRFRALLDAYAGRSPLPEARQRMLAALQAAPVERQIRDRGGLPGLRSAGEVAARARALLADAEAPPLPAGQVEILEALFALRAATPAAIERLYDLAVDLPALLPAVERLEARALALAARGIAVEGLEFEASFGRTTLEYYDGFVFGFYAPARPDLPPVASGGRYDALTAQLGAGGGIPAVGGVIRPGVVADLGGL